MKLAFCPSLEKLANNIGLFFSVLFVISQLGFFNRLIWTLMT